MTVDPIHFLWLTLGMLLLLGGGEVLVRGAVSLAKLLDVSTLIIGLTVVAFGTSAPELSVNINAALSGNGGISYGNIIGSNIANVGLILGVTALLAPLAIQPSIVKRDLPFMLLGTAAVIIMALLLSDADGAQMTRLDGVVLGLMFAFFMTYTLLEARKQRRNNNGAGDEEDEKSDPVWLALVYLFLGLAGVLYGGELTKDAAVTIAEQFGVSQAVIGLTIVAIGTSLPELVTCVMAVRKDHGDLSVGNVVGSNIFNLLLVLAATLMVSKQPIAVPDGGVLDLLLMAGLSLVLLPMALLGGHNINRVHGALLLLTYVVYLTWRSFDALQGRAV
ncbi:MAG: calcium/sodium antiporter [Planctomycetota bacterium]|jgi:cation:H+ antiporter